MLCRDASLVKHLPNARVITPLRCKCWGCERCSIDRRKELIWLGRHGNPNRFLTLTRRREAHIPPDEAARQLAHAWLLLRRRIRRHKGWKKLPFLAVFEKHKSGYPHLHIMLRCGYLDQKWLSRQMEELLNSPIVDIRFVNDAGRAFAYITKYVGKNPARFAGCKRYWRSANYRVTKEPIKKPEDGPEVSWSVRSDHPLLIIKQARIDGLPVSFDGRRWIIHGAWDPW